MTPEEFARKMQELADEVENDSGHSYMDREDMHIAMDALMCEVLIGFGYGEGVEIFEHTPKWYA